MILSHTQAAIADFFEQRLRKARFASRQARLRRELARLPSYVAVETSAPAQIKIDLSIFLMTNIRHIRLSYETNRPIKA